MKINLPIISLDIVSVDELHINNLITSTKFDNYIDFKMKITDAMEEQCNMYTIHVPSKNSSKYEFERSIIVHRIDMKIIGNVFVTLDNLTYDLRVSYLHENRNNDKLYFINLFI